MTHPTILIIDDEENILELLDYNLSKEGYRIIRANSGEDGLAAAQSRKPDLIILDVMLPGINGLDVCRKLKTDHNLSNIPIIMISAKGEETDVVIGLELGADDYVSKPFSPRMILARIRAVLRRPSEPDSQDTPSPVNIHKLFMNPERHDVALNDQPLELTATEYRILYLLSRNPGKVYTRKQIVKGVHGDDYPVTERSIDVQINGLRKKLGSEHDYIETVRGVGYRFQE